jgi:Kef-type K+ transport system membrane component KefB
VALAYTAMVGASILLFLLIQHVGEGLVAPMPDADMATGRAAAHAQPNVLAQILLGLVVILIASRAVGALFRRFGQPPVIGEVLAGILLGPSLLGRLSPEAMAFIFPPSAAPVLGIVAQVGVLLFMFLVGVELNTTRLRERTNITLAVSQASIICPFLLGATLALVLYPRLSSQDVPFTAFALFLSVSMSVTAFPVLARILKDRNLQRTRMGTIAMTCAAVNDVTAWCLLALVVGVVQARLGGAALTVILALGYIAGIFLIVRPLLRRLVARHESEEGLSQPTMAILFVALLLSCLATETIGIHALFGAFLLGAIIPHDSRVGRALIDKLEDFIVVLLLPAFFAFTGLRTQIGLISGAEQWLFCGLIILVASAGKFGGSVIAGRATGLSWRDASALGILMNTRGLMELIVLNVGLDLKVISPRLFAMLVIMAVVTTFATTPILDRLVRGRWHEGKETGT